MIAYQVVAAVVYRVVLPIVLTLCATMRYSLSSYAYFILVLIGPLLPAPNIISMKGHTGRYLKAVAAISVINFILQLIFQIVLLSLPPYASWLKNCSWEEQLLRHFGFVRLDAITEEDGTRWLLPDCLMIVFGPGSFFIINKLILKQAELDARSDDDAPTHNHPNPYKTLAMRILNAIGTYIALILLGLSGIMVPSLTSSVYFFVFLGGATYWSLNNTLGRKFGLICRGMIILSVIHMNFLYLYQFQAVQRIWPPSSVPARIFGMTALQEVRCHLDPRTFYRPNKQWSRFTNPMVLLLLYYFLLFEVRLLLSNKALKNHHHSSTNVRYLIRRTTVRRKSRKSQKSQTSRNYSSSFNSHIHNGSILSLTSPVVSHYRKGSLISAKSAPVKADNGIVHNHRRQSAFSDVTPQLYDRFQHLCHPPAQFSHLLNSHRHNHYGHRYRQSFNSSVSNTSWPKYLRTDSTPSSALRTAYSYSMEKSLIPMTSDSEGKVGPDTETPLSPFFSTSMLSETVSDGVFTGLHSTTSSHRSSLRNRNMFSFLQSNSFSQAPSSGAVSLAGFPLDQKPRRGTSFRSLKNEKRHSHQVHNTSTIAEEKEEGCGVKLFDKRLEEGIREHIDEEDHPLQRLMAPLITILQLLTRSSYIATNIVMMAWSITYHSWLTFVLLMWACILWMIPNQRAAMLRCSPFLVIYAEFLLVLQYIYCLDLTDDELPSEVDGMNLGQVGLLKYPLLPMQPLLVKVLYTSMFWITLRQYVQEVMESQTEMTSAAASHPFTVAVTTTPSGPLVTKDETHMSSPVMEKFGMKVKSFLVKLWIWLVAINLFAFGIHGSEVVIFRIMYMVFFLIFLITFQLSYSAWRKSLYWFWLVVIIYQMFVLVLTYTYQFDNFPTYWENYTGIPRQLQNDIGLEVYDTGRLFIKLMTPTFFVIVTIIQVHYFHTDFLEFSDIENVKPSVVKKPEKKPEEKKKEVKLPNLLDSCTLEELKAIIFFIFVKVSTKLGKFLKLANEFTWRFLEIHIIKIVLGSVMLLACYDVCLFHFVFALLASVAVLSPGHIQIGICRACVVITSLLLICRMIYQIDYINEYGIAKNCSSEYPNYTLPMYPLNESANTAAWLGLRKAPSLTKYLKGYIGIIVVITIQAVVVIRQQYKKLVSNSCTEQVNILFPNINRASADDGITECVKFIFNYGFYKFGVECQLMANYIKQICLIGLVGVIGTRLDFYSLYYAFWLCYFFTKRRKDIAHAWKGFSISIGVLIPIQYLMCIGMPPTVCVDYPWAVESVSELREWLFFPDFVKPPESYKIVTDFCLLVCAVCQQKVFDIEFGDDPDSYDGGSNKEIVYEDLATLVNPVPDFVTYTRTSLDRMKVTIFFSSYWLTLAVMFLTGTNRTTLFAMGYVIGAFIFLWQGNEFYLRPLAYILKLWNVLLGYNVMVIVIKAFLQLLGCAFMSELAINACWFVQLFGIACVKKFGDESDDEIVAKYASVCAVPKTEAGLLWDGICFAALLLQRRLFSSFYFQHLVTEIKAQTELASRGAELIMELMQKELVEQQAAEREVLNKIKEKMEQIKATQRKMSKQVDGCLIPDQYEANTLEQFSNASSPLPLELTSGQPYDQPKSRSHLDPTPAARSPSSANMTMSLDGYMEPSRLSITAPYIPLQPPITSPSDESFPVFSPPPYHSIRHRHTIHRVSSQPGETDIGPPWLKDQIRQQMERHRKSEPNISPSASHHLLATNATSAPTKVKWALSQSIPCLCSERPHPQARRWTMPQLNKQPRRKSDAIRSGDYYMFADYEEEDDRSLLPIDVRESGSDTDDPIGMTVSELISTAIKTDIEHATEEAKLARMSEFEYGIASSRKSSFKNKRQMHRTFSGRSQLSGRSAFSQISRASRSTSLSVRIDERPHKVYSLPCIPDAQDSCGRLPPPTGLPPLPPVPPSGPGSYVGDSATHDYSEIGPADPRGLSKLLRKMMHYFNFGRELVKSMMISLTLQLNRLSKDHRYVSACLSVEKRRLKETDGFSVIPVAPAIISSSQPDWPDLPLKESSKEKSSESLKDSKQSKENLKSDSKRASDKQSEVLLTTSLATSADDTLKIILDPASDEEGSVEFFELPDDADTPRDHSVAVHLLLAFWYAILSRSELVAYIMIFVNMIKSASILALPLPFMVFLWGSLSIPRPPKTFWICVIAYTEAIVMIKCVFQFDFFPWNVESRLNAPFWAPRIIGIEKKDRYAVYDLALLLVIFFHRFMLKSFGLWKQTSDIESEVSSTITGDQRDDYSVDPSSAVASVIEQPSVSSAGTEIRDLNHSRELLVKQSTTDSSDDSQIKDSFDKDSSSTLTSGTKDSSLLSTAGNSVLSLVRHPENYFPKNVPNRSVSMDDHPSSVEASEIYYTKPFLESNLDSSLASDSRSSTLRGSGGFSNSTTLSSRGFHRASSLNTELGKRLETLDIEDIESSSRRPSVISFKDNDQRQTFCPRTPVSEQGLAVGDRRESEMSRDTRKTSFMMAPTHRRQLSVGSQVSFQDMHIPLRERRPSNYRGRSYSLHSGFTDQSSSLGINCHNINLDRLRNIKKPNMGELREQVRKLPQFAMDRADRGRELILKFIYDLLHPKYQLSINAYTYMFICDFFNFFVLIFGFSAFGTQQGDGGVSAYLEENRVPIPFLVMLILQFALIIIDRALFLRKYILGKLIFQVGLTFGIHIWMFFILPAVTEREFNAKRPPQIFYMVKCLYLLLSAYQIRCGYPTRVLGNFFCKNYNLLNNFSFRVFMNVPFLYELRTLMDWIWTDTSMNLSDWIKMEDIFVRVFQLKCERRLEMEYPQGRGQGKRRIIKYMMGGCSLFVVIGLIWFPLILFALSSTVGLSNPPYDVSLEITIGSYQPVFKMTAQQQDLYTFNLKDWDDFNYHYVTDRTAQTFLGNYDAGDVVVAQLSGKSKSVWGISPPAKREMIEELRGNYSLKTIVAWSLKRPSNSADVSPESKGKKEIIIEALQKDGSRNPTRTTLAEILQGKLYKNPVQLRELFPKFLKVTNKGTATYVKQLAKDSFVDLRFSLKADSGENSTVAETATVSSLSGQEWWEVQEECPRDLSWLPRDKKCEHLTIYTFSDKAFPKGLSFISGGGIIGMYTTLVLLVSKWLRTHFAGVSSTIMFDDMPNVDRLLQLCLDIYLVRESKELELEEDLFAKLIFLFRSPETLIKWSRPKEEDDSQDENPDHSQSQ